VLWCISIDYVLWCGEKIVPIILATTKSIQIQVSTKAQRNSWVGIGVSKTGGMIGSREIRLDPSIFLCV
jgi:hypothetical protein